MVYPPADIPPPNPREKILKGSAPPWKWVNRYAASRFSYCAGRGEWLVHSGGKDNPYNIFAKEHDSPKAPVDRKNFVGVVYYAALEPLLKEEGGGRIMVPHRFIENMEDKIWGSIAYVSYPGSPITVVTRKQIEEILDGIKIWEAPQYFRTNKSFFKESKEGKGPVGCYSYWLLPAGEIKFLAVKGGDEWKNYPEAWGDRYIDDMPYDQQKEARRLKPQVNQFTAKASDLLDPPF